MLEMLSRANLPRNTASPRSQTFLASSAGIGWGLEIESGSLFIAPSLLIQVPSQILRRHLALHATGRNLDLGGPQDGVEHQLAAIVVAPIALEVAAGKAEPLVAMGKSEFNQGTTSIASQPSDNIVA